MNADSSVFYPRQSAFKFILALSSEIVVQKAKILNRKERKGRKGSEIFFLCVLRG
jgi:hypothetical protein